MIELEKQLVRTEMAVDAQYGRGAAKKFCQEEAQRRIANYRAKNCRAFGPTIALLEREGLATSERIALLNSKLVEKLTAPAPAPAPRVPTFTAPAPSVTLPTVKPPAPFKLTLDQLHRLATEIFGSEKVGMAVPPEPILRDEKLAKRIVRAESSTHEMNLLRQELARRPGQSASEKQEEHDRQYRRLCRLFYEGGLTLPGVDFRAFDFDPLTPAQLAAPKASPRTHALAQRIIDDFAATLQGAESLTQQPHHSRGAQAAQAFLRATKARA